jgi:hypothetical protein
MIGQMVRMRENRKARRLWQEKLEDMGIWKTLAWVKVVY